MSFINWGGESPEQLQIRRRMEEEQAIFEQASRMAVAQAAGVGGGSAKPRDLVGVVDWLSAAPTGEGLPEQDFENFDEWTTAAFGTLYNVKRLAISSTSANAHVHGDLPYSDLSIRLHNRLTDQWVTVWSYRLNNPNYPGDDSDDFFMNGIDVVFAVIPEVDKIRVYSDPGSDQSYHDWGTDPTLFSFYG